MPSVAVITDTDSSIPERLAAEHNIRLVPIAINFGQESLRSGVDIDERRLFERIDEDGKLPTTAAPSPGAFVEAYQAAFDDGADQVLCICVSSEISSNSPRRTARERHHRSGLTHGLDDSRLYGIGCR